MLKVMVRNLDLAVNECQEDTEMKEYHAMIYVSERSLSLCGGWVMVRIG